MTQNDAFWILVPYRLFTVVPLWGLIDKMPLRSRWFFAFRVKFSPNVLFFSFFGVFFHRWHMQHISEILKIIEGGVRLNSSQVVSYAQLLAEKLKNEGCERQASSVLKKLSVKNGMEGYSPSAGANSMGLGMPVDKDSRLSLGDESWPDLRDCQVQLVSSVKETVAEFLRFIEKSSLLSEAGVGVSPSMLIYGPPGCGKTQLAKYVAASLELPLITARCDTIISSFLGSTAKNIRNLFDHAASRPCVLFLDEFDAIAKARDDHQEIGELKRVVVSLLQNIDALPDDTIVISATNHESLLDPAVWRRFDYKLKMSEPDEEVRLRLFEQFLSGYAPKNLKLAVDISQGLSGSIIEQVCKASIRKALVDGRSKILLDDLILRIIKELHSDTLSLPVSDEEKAVLLRGKDKKLFTMTRLSNLLGMSVGKISKTVT